MEERLDVFFNDNLSEDTRAALCSSAVCVETFLQNLCANSPQCPGVAFITTGGTSVPLEVNAVRYITNFSSGGRGANLVESFVERGWACVVLRHKSAIRPFRRVLDSVDTGDLLDAVCGATLGNDLSTPDLLKARELHRRSKALVVEVTFDTVMEYLFLLRHISGQLCTAGLPANALPLLFFSAAAVSDYYVPLKDMSLEKISGKDGLNLHLENVPKVLGHLQSNWLRRVVPPGAAAMPQPYIITFKLETSEPAMHEKAQYNMAHYSCDAVVANMLQTYKKKVWVYIRAKEATAQQQQQPRLVCKGSSLSIESVLCDFFIDEALSDMRA